MCEKCIGLKISGFEHELEWDRFDLELVRLIFKDKLKYIKYIEGPNVYSYQCTNCNTTWQLKEPLFASFGYNGFFVPVK